MTKSQNSHVVSAEAPTVVGVVVAACPVVAVVHQWAAGTAADQITVVDHPLVLSMERPVSCVIRSELDMATGAAVVAAVDVAIRSKTKTLLKNGPLSFGNFVTVKLSQYCNMLSTVKVLVEN